MQHDTKLRSLGQGENLFASSGTGWETTSEGSEGWYSEESKYNYQSPGSSWGTGHFTQMIWNSTCRIGCAHAGSFMVCRYKEAGNSRNIMEGWKAYTDNVKPPQGLPIN